MLVLCPVGSGLEEDADADGGEVASPDVCGEKRKGLTHTTRTGRVAVRWPRRGRNGQPKLNASTSACWRRMSEKERGTGALNCEGSGRPERKCPRFRIVLLLVTAKLDRSTRLQLEPPLHTHSIAASSRQHPACHKLVLVRCCSAVSCFAAALQRFVHRTAGHRPRAH